MGLIKEYVDRAVQTDSDAVPSPYADPAVVLAAPPVTRHGLVQEAHADSISTTSSTGSGSAYAVSQSPTSPMLAPLVSRRLSKRKHARLPVGEAVNRRIVSMPENNSEAMYHSSGKRVVSMPDRVRPVLEPSAELFQSTSTAARDSLGSYSRRNERVRVLRAPSDVPQTPSPPSSPESLLIIAAGTQLPEGFLRRKYSPEPLIEEEEGTRIAPDWITWANSPPRPIPALHGPLSLPYARCPSGAEGTIIEEPDNVAQMIWGLGPDDQPHNQVRAEGVSSYPGNSQNTSHGLGQVPPRLQKKRSSATQQVPKLARTQTTHTGPTKQARDDRRSPLRVSPDIEARQDIVGGLPWNEVQSMPNSVGVSDDFVNDSELLPVDNNRILEWQLARLRRVLRTSLADMESYTTYAGRLEPVIPATANPGLPQSYPRIFVEPRPNESVNYAPKQSPIEITHQYRQQQLYRQALHKQKLQIQNILPTPPNSSSPQWSSHFSPYLSHGSTFSPEPAGSTEYSVPVSSPKYRPSTNLPQHLRHICERHERNDINNFDTSTNISSTRTLQTELNVNSVPSLGQSSSSSSTLAKYIKQLQALSPITNFSPPQPVPPSNASLAALPSTDDRSIGPFRTAYHPPVVPTPPSPESPQMLSRGSSHHSSRSIRPVQRRLSSVPEEDSAGLELSMSFSPSRLQSQIVTDISSSHEGTMGHQPRYTDATRRSAIPDLPGFEGNIGAAPMVFHHETSPVKVRLPVTKEHNVREQSRYHEQNKEGNQHGYRKKHRHKKPKGPPGVNEQATRGLVG